MKHIKSLPLLLLSSSLILCGCNNKTIEKKDSSSLSSEKREVFDLLRYHSIFTFNERTYERDKEGVASSYEKDQLIGFIVSDEKKIDLLKNEHKDLELTFIVDPVFYNRTYDEGELYYCVAAIYSLIDFSDQSKILMDTFSIKVIFNEVL